jgi:hypothetical protein
VRLCAYRKDREGEGKGLEALRKTNGRKHGGKEMTKRRRACNRHVVAAASLGGEGMSARRVMEPYRLRRQTGLAFKRLKTVFDCHEPPVKIDGTTLALFYGKLLLAALCEQITRAGRFSPGGGREEGRRGGKRGATESVAGNTGGEDAGNAAVASVVFSPDPPGCSEVWFDNTRGVCRYEAEKAHATAPV